MKVNAISFKAGMNSLYSSGTIKPQASDSKSSESDFKGKIPYVIGVLAVAGTIFAFRNKISKIINKLVKKQENPDLSSKNVNQTKNLPSLIYDFPVLRSQKHRFILNKEILAQIKGEQPFKFKINIKQPEAVSPKSNIPKNEDKVVKRKKYVKPQLEVKEQKQNVDLKKSAANVKNICIGFGNDGKPIYAEIEMPDVTSKAISAYDEALKSVNFSDKKIISKIERNLKSQQININRIIGENNHNGYIDMHMMRKVANDYIADAKRGVNKYHQAADLLEQAHIKGQFRDGVPIKTSLSNIISAFVTDPVLYKCYQNMPLEESAIRLRHFADFDLKSCGVTDSKDADRFFEMTFNRLVEKYQMKRYNQAHGIKV